VNKYLILLTYDLVGGIRISIDIFNTFEFKLQDLIAKTSLLFDSHLSIDKNFNFAESIDPKYVIVKAKEATAHKFIFEKTSFFIYKFQFIK
jgi:hypothetical protein